jgi:hypothetical protein
MEGMNPESEIITTNFIFGANACLSTNLIK